MSMLIDAMPVKRPKVSPETTRRISQSHDHDYCSSSVTLCKSISVVGTSTQQTEPTAVTSSLSAAPSANSTSLQEQSKMASAVPKVLKWEDYLQQVRLGTRSAPNSPTCSPKIQRGSIRTPNNFMVVSVQDSISSNRSVNLASKTSIKNQKEQTTLGASNKQDITLQGFNEYINHLKKKMNNPEAAQDKMPLLVITTSKPQVKSNGPSLNTSTLVPHKRTPASHVLSAMVRKQKVMVRKGEEKAFKVKPQVISTTENTKKPKPSSAQCTTASSVSTGSSGQFLMIQIPTTSGSSMALPLLQKISNKTSSLDLKHVDTANKNALADVTRPLRPSARISAMSTSPNIAFVCPTSAVVNLNSVSNQTLVHTTNSKVHTISVSRPNGKNSDAQSMNLGNVTKPPVTTPTFKLVTSKDGGRETKSLVLSGVTGPLKDILLRLAKQQADNKVLQMKGSPGELEQQTMQNLIDVVGTLKSSEGTNVVAEMGKSDCITVQKKLQPVNCKNPKNLAAVCPTLTLAHEIKQNLSKKSSKPLVEKSAKVLKLEQENMETLTPVISTSPVNSLFPATALVADSALDNSIKLPKPASTCLRNSVEKGSDANSRTELVFTNSSEKVFMSSTVDTASNSNASRKIPTKDGHQVSCFFLLAVLF